MAERKKEAERASPLKRSWDDCCVNDDRPALQENPAEGSHLVSAGKRQKNNNDFDKNNRDPMGLVFDEADSNSYFEPTVAEVREYPTETTELGSSNYCKRDGRSEDSSSSSVNEELQTAASLNEAACSSSMMVEGNTHSTSCEDENDDNISEISDLSSLGIESWRPTTGAITWVQEQMQEGVDPRLLLSQLVSPRTNIPSDFDDFTLWKIIINVLTEPPKRHKLKDINTLDDVIHLLKTSNKIMVLTGAGVSVSCGIPDFRSRDGVYARLAMEYPDLPDPQAMFDIEYFKKNPRPFFKFAKEIYPGQFKPSLSHHFIKLIEDHNKLLRNYTQNIDTLEQAAGLTNIIQCHGSFATATCMSCKYRTDSEAIKDDIKNQVIPRCPQCPPTEPMAIMKPDIVFFGESLPREFHRQMEQDKDVCDLLIVIGSSLKVRPVALIPSSLPPHVPQILINRETLRHLTFDVELLGDCDVILNELCLRLRADWTSACTSLTPAREIRHDEMSTKATMPTKVTTSPPPSAASTPHELANTDEHVQSSSNVTSASVVVPSNSTGFVNVDNETWTADSTVDATTTPADSHVQADAVTSTADTSSGVCPSSASSAMVESSCAPESEAAATSSCHPSSLAAGLQDNTFLFLPPNKYIFKGAEVYNYKVDSDGDHGGDDDDEDDDDDDDDDDSISDDDSIFDELSEVDNESNCNNHNNNKVTTSVDTPHTTSANASSGVSSSGSRSADVSRSCSANSKDDDDTLDVSSADSPTTESPETNRCHSSTSTGLG